VEEELKQAKTANMPLENTIKALEKEKDSLEKINEGLVNDNSYYSERLKKLYANYDNIDPEEHRLLQVKISQMEADANELKTELSDLRTEIQSKEKYFNNWHHKIEHIDCRRFTTRFGNLPQIESAQHSHVIAQCACR
jgi:predicted RNase H-like nuclease (RuvC/YqgF family)